MLRICHLTRCSARILLYTIVHEVNVCYMLYTMLCKLTSYTLASTQCTIQHLTHLQAKVLHLFSCHLLVTATKTIMAHLLTNSLYQLPSSEKKKLCSPYININYGHSNVPYYKYYK